MVAAKSQSQVSATRLKIDSQSIGVPSVTIPRVPSAPINSFVRSNPAEDFLNSAIEVRSDQPSVSQRSPVYWFGSHLARCLVLMTSPSARTAVWGFTSVMASA